MFETLFNYPSVLARHREGPAAEERQRFLVHRANQDAARSTLLRTARDLLIIAENIDVAGSSAICNHDVEVAAAKWARHQRCGHHSHGPRRSRALFLGLATSLRSIARGPAHTVSFRRPNKGLCPLHARGTGFVRGNDPRSMLARGEVACLAHESKPLSC